MPAGETSGDGELVKVVNVLTPAASNRHTDNYHTIQQEQDQWHDTLIGSDSPYQAAVAELQSGADDLPALVTVLEEMQTRFTARFEHLGSTGDDARNKVHAHAGISEKWGGPVRGEADGSGELSKSIQNSTREITGKTNEGVASTEALVNVTETTAKDVLGAIGVALDGLKTFQQVLGNSTKDLQPALGTAGQNAQEIVAATRQGRHSMGVLVGRLRDNDKSGQAPEEFR
jgi:hypothetical protein